MEFNSDEEKIKYIEELANRYYSSETEDEIFKTIESLQEEKNKKDAIEIIIDRRHISDNTIGRFTAQLLEDESKIEILRSNLYSFESDFFLEVIQSLQKDDDKLKALEICEKRMYSTGIARIIDSLQEEGKKLDVLNKYKYLFQPGEYWSVLNNIQEDTYKLEFLRKLEDRTDLSFIYHIIVSIREDKNKLEAMMMYDKELRKSEYVITNIIESIQDDENKSEALKKYVDAIGSKRIDAIIKSLQESRKKIDLLKEYALNGIDIVDIIETLQNDSEKIYAFNEYSKIKEASEHDICYTIRSLQDEDNKVNLFKKYADYFKGDKNSFYYYDHKYNDSNILEILASIKEEKNKVEVLKAFANTLDRNKGEYYTAHVIESIRSEGHIGSMIKSMQEEENKAEALKTCSAFFYSSSIVDMIKTFQEDEMKFKVLQALQEKLQSNEMKIIILSMQEDSIKAKILDEIYKRIGQEELEEIIISLKDDDIKNTQLEKYKDSLQSAIGGIVRSFQDDEKKIKLFKNNIAYIPCDNYVSIFSSFYDDKNTILMLKQYEDILIEERTRLPSLLCSVECNAENYSLLCPELDEYVKQYPKILGKNNLNDLKEYFFSEIKYVITSPNFGADTDGYYIFGYNAEIGKQEYENAKNEWTILKKWIEIGFIPQPKLMEKVPEEKVGEFVPQVWFKLAKEPVFNISEESKMALVELAYCFGVFDKNEVEIRGKSKNISEIKDEERRSGQAIDYQKRVQSVLDMVHSGELTNENLHMMFDGTNMKFDPAFYRFFMDNKDTILSSEEIMRKIPDIQRNMPEIMKKFRGNIPNIEQCNRYFAEITYTGIQEGNEHLAETCKLAGVPQDKFDAYQELFAEQKARDKESTIPQLKGKNYEILELTDPETLIIGEGGFSRCCQQIGGAGEQCMRHSATSQNGRLVVIHDDDGRFIAQSWMWRNGNVVCFDSIEANALESNTDAEQDKNIGLIVKTYREIANTVIEETSKTVEKFRKEKLEVIKKEEIGEEEKKRKIDQLERVCDGSSVKRVTVGQGYWPISQRITEHFSNRVVSDEHGRVEPRESVSYINDSDTQFIIAEVKDLKEEEIKTNEAQVEVRYRDRRKTEVEVGEDIEDDTLFKIKQIEKEAHKTRMQEMDNVHTVYDLADVYGVEPENLRVIHGEDWYYVYTNEENSIHVLDLARGKSRFEDEKMQGSNEMGKALDQIMLEATKSGKVVEAELREDTSYILLLELKKNGLIEQVGLDETFEYDGRRRSRDYDEDEYYDDYNDYDNEYSERREVSEEEQMDILNRKDEIRQREATEENTTMHHMTFKPTEKYIRVLERRYNRKEAEH